MRKLDGLLVCEMVFAAAFFLALAAVPTFAGGGAGATAETARISRLMHAAARPRADQVDESGDDEPAQADDTDDTPADDAADDPADDTDGDDGDAGDQAPGDGGPASGT